MLRLVAGLLVLAALPSLAAARQCGDDVDGRTIPCACGDVLVSARTLDDDPIVHDACSGVGLLVDVPESRKAILSLAGHTIAGGGHGAGIRVVRGGVDGLTITGPGTVGGFDVGIVAPVGGLARATDVTVAGTRRVGFVVGGTGAVLTGCTAARNGGDGFSLRGRGHRLEGNRALDNHVYGFLVTGHAATLGENAGNEAIGNRRGGFHVNGEGHAVAHAVASGNGGPGIHARFRQGGIVGAVTSGNAGPGLRVVGSDVRVTNADARDDHRPVEIRGRVACEGTACP